MCGIAGIVDLEAGARPAAIRAMTGALAHRGPDDVGYLAASFSPDACLPYRDDGSAVAGDHISQTAEPHPLWLGHRRLSIIEVGAAGHQPMSGRDGDLWIVYNGEIYNYIELRAELEHAGRSFSTRGDTEVILAAYEKWGDECPLRFNGMWAFAIYDRRRRRLFASRDRFGVKPFYYLSRPGGFAFASEIRALLQSPGARVEMNEGALFDYLVIGQEDVEAESFFLGVRELPPACNLALDLHSGELRIAPYYRLPCNLEWRRPDAAARSRHASEIRERIFSAVSLRLRSDVPLGSCLSGGIDSSALVGVIDALLRTTHPPAVGLRQQVFTASYPGDPGDESPFARLVVDKTGSVWHETHPDARGLVLDIEDLVRSQEIPFSSSSIYAHYCVCRLAAGCGVKVLLDGQGGDEIFAGSTEFYRAFFLEALRRFDLRRIAGEWRSLDHAPLSRRALAAQMRNSLLKRLLPAAARRFFYRRRDWQTRFLRRDFWMRQRHRLDRYRGRDFFSLNRTLHEFVTRFQLKTLLRYEDRNSMRFGLESRTPFADDWPLIEYLFSVPGSLKIHEGWSKSLLRESLRDLLPPAIAARRDKKGFSTPERGWLQQAGPQLLDYFDSGLDDLLQVRRLRDEWPALVARQPEAGMTPLWRLLNFAVWKRVFSVKC